jgi:preprotein translocase subunit SecF
MVIIMGLYNQDGPVKLRKDKQYIIIGVVVFVIVILLAILIFSINWAGDGFSGNNLSVKFSKNPYVLSKDTELKILVTIENNSEIDATDSAVTIIPVENYFFITCDASAIENNSVVIPIISKDSSRVVSCDVKISPTINKAEILPGTYSFDVKYILNNTPFEKRAKLTIK